MAEIPLPDAIVYGTITRGGEVVGSGEVVGRVSRGDREPLEVRGEFRDSSGTPHYVLRIPLESDVGAPGPAGAAAREGDVLEAILLRGGEIDSPGVVLASAKIERRDISDGGPTAPRFIRGDCNGDGALDVSDPMTILLSLFGRGGILSCQSACDAEDSGQVNMADATFLLDSLFQNGVDPAHPYPGCGIDPTPDDLTCATSQTGCGAGEGGEVGRVVLALGAPESAERPGERRRTPEAGGMLATPGGGPGTLSAPTDEQQLAALMHHLEITPPTIRMGEVAHGPSSKTLTFKNTGPQNLELTLALDTDLFSVFPASFTLPAGGSFIGFVERAPPRSGPDTVAGADDVSEHVLVSSGETLLRRVPIEHTSKPDLRLVRIGNAVVRDGSTDPIVLPIETSPGPGRLALTLDYDRGRFDVVGLVSADDGVSIDNVAPSDEGYGAEITISEPGVGPTVARFILAPRAPLPAGTYPVLLQLGGDTTSSLTAAHGEICAQHAWLDVDGDGQATLAMDTVLVARYYAGRQELQPGSWEQLNLDEEYLRQTIDSRRDYLDVDGSGSFDLGDLAAIARGLSGFRVPGRDRAARVRNLFVSSAVYPGVAMEPENEPALPVLADAHAEVSLQTCLVDGGEMILEGRFTSAESLNASHVHLEIDYPPELLMFDTVERAGAPGRQVEIEVEDDPTVGRLEAVVYDPEGGMIGSAENVLQWRLRPGALPTDALTLSVIPLTASLGRHVVKLRGAITVLSSDQTCEPNCAETPRPDEATSHALALLDFLFGTGARPDCFDQLDTDRDGRLTMSDVIRLLDRSVDR